MADLTITMLGASGAGKTCFLVGLYNALRVGVRGFTLLATDATPDADTDLELAELWERMQEGGQDRWPAPTDSTRDFTFALQYAYQTVLTFDWLDYRGGALTDQPTEADVRALTVRLQRSSAIFLCVPGDTLVGTPRNAAKTDRMNVLLGRVRNSLAPQSPIPTIVVVVTKYDLCADSGLLKEQVFDAVKRLFPPLFVPGGRWLVTVCPVSLGRGLPRDREHAAIQPQFVHLPVTFVACMELKRRIDAGGSTIEDIERRRRALGGHWFWEWWNSQEISQAAQALAIQQQHLSKAKEDLAYMEREVAAAVTMYYDGVEYTYDL
jgi:hypothetical protein